jgi:deferrochelatase/peroxidase EfeB
MTDGRSAIPVEEWSDGGCQASGFSRRSFLRGTVAAGLAGAATGSLLGSDTALAHTASGGALRTGAVPFQDDHQAGIATPPQPVGTFVSFDVTAADRRQLGRREAFEPASCGHWARRSGRDRRLRVKLVVFHAHDACL